MLSDWFCEQAQRVTDSYAEGVDEFSELTELLESLDKEVGDRIDKLELLVESLGVGGKNYGNQRLLEKADEELGNIMLLRENRRFIYGKVIHLRRILPLKHKLASLLIWLA